MIGTVAPPPEGTATTGPSRWRRPRRDLVVLVVTALVGVTVLLWGGDRLARSAAESLVTRELQRLTGTLTPPDVELHGASFLVQALRGRYERVDVTMSGLSSGPMRIQRVDARLSGVRLPFPELLLRNPGAMAVERATGRAQLTYDDLEAYLKFTGRPYSVRAGTQPDAVAITGAVQVLGREYDVSVEATLGAEAGALTITPTQLDTGSDLDRAAELLLDQRFTFVVPLDPLPFGQRVVGIEAGPDVVVVRTEVEGLVLRPR